MMQRGGVYSFEAHSQAVVEIFERLFSRLGFAVIIAGHFISPVP